MPFVVRCASGLVLLALACTPAGVPEDRAKAKPADSGGALDDTRAAASVVSSSSVAKAPERLPAANVEYDAHMQVASGRLVLSGPIHYGKDRERRTLELEGARVPEQVMIIRRDKGLAWMMNPSRKSYYHVPLGMASGRPIVPDLLEEKVPAGRETIAGVPTTKYRVRFAENEGTRLSGELWLTDQNIVLRIDGQTTASDGARTRPFRMKLEKLKVRPQRAELFEVPEGYEHVASSHPTLGAAALPPSRRPGDERDARRGR